MVKALPGLQPEACDVEGANVEGTGVRGADAHPGGASTMLVDFAGTLSGLLHRRTVKVASVPQWKPSMKGDLTSAISGGQWSQTRRASVPHWGVTDLRCQLCLAAPGTLEHRHECVCTVPTEGWPLSPPKTCLAIRRVGRERANLLHMRGLLVMRLPSPPPPTEGWFNWLVPPSPDSNEQHTWYLDGSLQDGHWVEYRAVGFGRVVVAPDGSLIANCIWYGCAPKLVQDCSRC